MSRRKQQPTFIDASDIYLETSSAAAVRDLAVMVSTYARARKLPFKVTITDVEAPKTQGSDNNGGEFKLVEEQKTRP